GYDSGQEFLYIASELIQYKPDLLIVYDGWNDEYSAEQRSPSSTRSEIINLFKSGNHLLDESRLTESYSVLGSLQLLAGNINSRTRAAMHQTGIYWLIAGLTSHIIKHSFPDQPKPAVEFDPKRVQIYESNLTNVLSV